ncbi:MAG: acyltransferase family protein [Oscillochloris sp.]|nr:acyltransferase family protein [Oscillochloris sp.]
MSDKLRPQDSDGPDGNGTADSDHTKPRRIRRSRAAQPSEAPEQHSNGDQSVEQRTSRRKSSRSEAGANGTAPTDPAPADDIPIRRAEPAPVEEVFVRQPERSPDASNLWGKPSGEPFEEIEITVRNQSAQAGEQAAAMGNLAAGLIRLMGDNLRRMTESQVAQVQTMLKDVDLKDYLDPAFWQGIGMVLQYQIDEQVAFFKRRMAGEYTTDTYGMDREIIEIVKPFLSFMYYTWWRVSPHGLENVPADGRTLLVSNHSGVLPWDGAMIAAAVANDHPTNTERIVRSLHLHWFSTLPLVAPALAAMGQVPGIPENAVRLLENDELVCVFPEGLKGVGKLYKDRYQLARFGRGGFVQAALRAQAPIVPVAVVGAEEIYPMFANVEPIAKLLGFPYFPLTPFFPWLGLLGVIPLPTQWSITFCPPLDTEGYGPEAADDPLIVLALTEQVRSRIQDTINERLAERTSVF